MPCLGFMRPWSSWYPFFSSAQSPQYQWGQCYMPQPLTPNEILHTKDGVSFLDWKTPQGWSHCEWHWLACEITRASFLYADAKFIVYFSNTVMKTLPRQRVTECNRASGCRELEFRVAGWRHGGRNDWVLTSQTTSRRQGMHTGSNKEFWNLKLQFCP